MARIPVVQRKLAVGTAALFLVGFCVQSALSAGKTVHQSGIVVSGTVVDANKQPVASLHVLLSLPPVDAAGSIGRKSIVIGSTTTDAAGRFSLKAEVTSQLRKLGSINDNWLNFDLDIYSSTLLLYQGVPRQIVKTVWGGPPENNGSTNLGTLVFAPGQPGVGPSKHRSVAAVRIAGRQTCDPNPTNTTLGSATLVTTVGELHTASGSAHFDYGSIADSWVSILVMVGSAPWSDTLTNTHVANTLSHVAVSATPGFHHLVRSYFKYVKVRTSDGCGGVRITIKATKWESAKLVLGTMADPSSACAATPWVSHVQTFGSGGSFLRNSNLAYRFKKAVDLTPLGGPATLASARSGYSNPNRVSVAWQFPSGGKLCGDNNPPSTSKRIAAGG